MLAGRRNTPRRGKKNKFGAKKTQQIQAALDQRRGTEKKCFEMQLLVEIGSTLWRTLPPLEKFGLAHLRSASLVKLTFLSLHSNVHPARIFKMYPTLDAWILILAQMVLSSNHDSIRLHGWSLARTANVHASVVGRADAD